MCNHYRSDPAMMRQLPTWRDFIGADIALAADLPEPATEVWPKSPALIVRSEEGVRIVDVMHWGVPTRVPGKRIRNFASSFPDDAPEIDEDTKLTKDELLFAADRLHATRNAVVVDRLT